MLYKKEKFTDGQITVKITDIKDPVVRERINSYEDLFLIKALVDAYRSITPKGSPIELYIPCMFGQRSDRRFKLGQSFDLKIICDFINSCNFDKVTIFDPHSDVTMALIDNSVKASSLTFVKLSVDMSTMTNTVLVSPDAGAYKKVISYANELKLPCVASNKYRDAEDIPRISFIGDVRSKRCLIVDDLIDGGRTFVELGKALKEQGAARVDLYVSHALFSYGYDEVLKVIDSVYCTNSIKDISHNFITQYNVL